MQTTEIATATATNNPAQASSSGAPTGTTSSTARWRAVEDAAAFLGMPARVLREALASNSREQDGVTEAHLDGIIGRKLGRRWRVWLTEKWTAPQTPTLPCPRHGKVPAAVNAGHGGKEVPHDRY